jgi:hypothetical protein
VRPEAQRLRIARVLLVTLLGLSALVVAPGAALGAGPEAPPVKAAPRLGPEPAPAARTATPVTQTSTPSTPTSQITTATPSRPVASTTASAPPQQRPATSARPKPKAPPPARPKANHAVKAAVRTIAHTMQRPATAVAFGAIPAGTSDSNRLLFLGGLALLVLVLGDATFLAISARVIREQR